MAFWGPLEWESVADFFIMDFVMDFFIMDLSTIQNALDLLHRNDLMWLPLCDSADYLGRHPGSASCWSDPLSWGLCQRGKLGDRCSSCKVVSRLNDGTKLFEDLQYSNLHYIHVTKLCQRELCSSLEHVWYRAWPIVSSPEGGDEEREELEVDIPCRHV